MTLIIGIQLQNSTIITADHRLTQDVGQANFKTILNNYQKIKVWNNKILTGSGDALLLKRIKNTVSLNEDSKCLSNRFLLEVKKRRGEIGTNEHTNKTKLLFSSITNTQPQLEFFSLDFEGNIYSNLVEPMSIEMTIKPEIIECLSESLVSLYASLKNINEFSSDDEWLNFYIKKLRLIYSLASEYDSAVSSTFHICGHTVDEILIKNIK